MQIRGRKMAYTEDQLMKARNERAALVVLIENRKAQEEKWEENKERVFVKTNNRFPHVSGLNLLDYAVKLGELETVKELVAQGLTSESAVLFALEGGDVEIAKFLLDKGFKYDIFTAVQKCDASCREFLIQSAESQFNKDYKAIVKADDQYYSATDLRPQSSQSTTNLLHYEALMPYRKFIALQQKIPENQINWKMGINSTDKQDAKKGVTPVGYAIASRNILFLEFLIEIGADVSKKVQLDMGYTPMQLAIRLGNLEAATFLKSKGASLDEVDLKGCSLLHLAIQSGDLKVVDFVLTHGENLRLVANYGRNPIHYLAECKNEEIIRMVLNRPITKPYVNQKDYFGETPLDFAKSHNNVFLMRALDFSAKLDTPAKINIRQGFVLNKLIYFLKVTNLGDPVSMPPGGYCNGFSFLFLYYQKRGLGDEFFKMLQLIANWDGDPAFLKEKEPVAGFSGKYENVADLFNQWVNDLIWFQQSRLEEVLKKLNPMQSSREAQYALLSKEEKPFTVAQRFLTRGEKMSEEQLNEYLAIFKEMPDLCVEFAKGKHATSLYVDKNRQLVYYDPNQTGILDPMSTASKLASHIKETKYIMLKLLDADQTMQLEIRYYPERNYKAFPNRTASWTPESYQAYYEASPNKLTPLHVAVIANDLDEIEKILKMQDIPLTLRDVKGRTALSLALSFDAENVIRLVCKHRPELIGENPEILPLAYKKNRNLLDYLLDNFSFKNSGGLLNQAVMNGDKAIVDKLLSKGISPDEQEKFGNPPIVNAVNLGHIDIVKSLIEAGAKYPNNTYSLQRLAENKAVCLYLIEHFPEKIMAMKDDSGKSFVHFMLVDQCVDDSFRKEILDSLVKNHFITKKKIDDEYLLHQIIPGLSSIVAVDFAKAFIEADADVSIGAQKAKTLPLHFAAVNFKKQELIQRLIDKGSPIDLDQPTAKGSRPLYLAIGANNRVAVETLLRAGANPDASTPDGKSIREWAKKEHPEMSKIIQRPAKIVTQFESTKKKIVLSKEEVEVKEGLKTGHKP